MAENVELSIAQKALAGKRQLREFVKMLELHLSFIGGRHAEMKGLWFYPEVFQRVTPSSRICAVDHGHPLALLNPLLVQDPLRDFLIQPSDQDHRPLQGPAPSKPPRVLGTDGWPRAGRTGSCR